MKVKVVKIIDNKTFRAVSTTYKQHLRYKKYITASKSYLVDYNGDGVELGAEVEIKQTRPISKRKRWALDVKEANNN